MNSRFVFRFFVAFVAFVPWAYAQAPARRVYISVDMEGISGVNGDDQTSAGCPSTVARKLMAEDANAAIRGAFEGARGLFAHTGSGVVRDLQINGRSVGEGGMNAALAAWLACRSSR